MSKIRLGEGREELVYWGLVLGVLDWFRDRGIRVIFFEKMENWGVEIGFKDLYCFYFFFWKFRVGFFFFIVLGGVSNFFLFRMYSRLRGVLLLEGVYSFISMFRVKGV